MRLSHKQKEPASCQQGSSSSPPPLRQQHPADGLTTASRRAFTTVWALLLMLWVVVAWNAQNGFSSSGPMNLQFAPSLLVVLSVPVSVFAPWAARVLGTRLQWAAALAVVALTCWWQFWLPATMVDIGYSVRYDIPNPYIWPGQPGSPALALSMALWLTAQLSDWEGWRPWVCWAMGTVCTTAAVLGLDWTGKSTSTSHGRRPFAALSDSSLWLRPATK